MHGAFDVKYVSGTERRTCGLARALRGLSRAILLIVTVLARLMCFTTYHGDIQGAHCFIYHDSALQVMKRQKYLYSLAEKLPFQRLDSINSQKWIFVIELN